VLGNVGTCVETQHRAKPLCLPTAESLQTKITVPQLAKPTGESQRQSLSRAA
jgi:hypothetical protein